MKLGILILTLLAAGGCQKQTAAQKPQEPEPHPESASNWTAKTELFMEYPPLIAGQISRFAIHFTRLDNFKAVAKGKVEVILAREGSPPESFATEGPSRPGIFAVDVKPSGAADYKVSVRLLSDGLNDIHEMGAIAAHATKTAAVHEHGAALPDLISFLKEQQWTLDFATAIVADQSLRSSLRVPAEVLPRSGGEAEVTSPFDGRLVSSRLPIVGERVTQGQVLTSLLPPTSSPSDVASLELMKNENTLALQLARKDRERAERLVNTGAAPAKRLDEARTVEATAEARVKAAASRLAQFESSSSAEANPRGSKLFALRAPISGIILKTDAAPGANVKSGAVLFQIIDVDRVYVAGVVPEADLPFVRNLSGAELEIPGVDQPRPLKHLISVGRIVDPKSRTFSVIYEVDNADRRIAINQAVYMRLLTQSSAATPVVPESALIDDGGRPIVFVQLAGETFQRKPVRLGLRESGNVQVLEGVFPGERVVTKGAHLVRLSSMSSQVPAHGHAH